VLLGQNSANRTDVKFDPNFKAEESGGCRFLLKIMRPKFDTELMEMKYQALQHIRTNAQVVNVAAVIWSKTERHFKAHSFRLSNDRLV
jgi:Ser/Thr protein kinase RdoA (MazF antagonist)